MSTELLIIVFLLGLNAFFAMSEMAIVSASKPLLRQYAKQGRRSAAVALALAENPGRFLSTVQVGITLVGTLAGVYGGATIAEKLKDPFNAFAFIAPHGEVVAMFVVVTLITYASVVAGELVPKQFALNNAEKVAMLVARPMSGLSRLCTPVVAVLEASAVFLMKVFRIRRKEEGITESEIRAVIADGVASGAIEGEEHDMIRRVIRLGDRDVKSIMTHRTEVKFISIDDTLEDVYRKVGAAGHSSYPVIDRDTTKVLGFVKASRIMAREGGACEGGDAGFQVRDYMDAPAFIDENTRCLDALNAFREQGLHIAGVVDAAGSFEGLFTTSDLLEAIVGTMPSNYDVDDGPLIVRREDGSWLVDGLTPIDEIHMVIGLEEIGTTAAYQTIAGFVLAQIQSGPAVGKAFVFAGHRFEIVDMDRHRIDAILIQKQAVAA